MKLIKIILPIFFALIITSNIHGQSVGLVLSGGGAKGLYHIGILKALEENSIPIDYVSGTSMGSIVAGMYAAGYSANEMEAIFLSDVVNYWLTGKIEDKYQYYYKKNDPTPAMLSIDVDLIGMIKKNKLKYQDTIPKKVIFSLPQKTKKEEKPRTYSMYSSIQLDLAMMYFFASASSQCKNNFDSLFVPFRCVSVDIYKKKEYLWRSGDLGMAIRSSMAIPIVFRPVQIDSMLMYDGGLRNNFPWKETKDAFNPDIIIGGKCVGGKTDLSSVVDQVEMLVMNQTNYDMPKEDGIMIERNVDVGMLEYEKAAVVIEMGYQDAIKMMPEIKERISRRVSPEETHIKRMKYREELPVLEFDNFDINGLTNRQREYIESQIASRQVSDGRSISYEEFKTDYLKIISEGVMDGDFPTATYNEENGLFDLNVDMYSKPSFKAMVGLNISSTSVNQAYLGLHYRSVARILSTYMIDGYIGSFYSSVKLGGRFNFYGGKNPYYIEPSLVYNFYDYARGNSQRISYKSSDLGYSRYNDFYTSLVVGMPISRTTKFEFRTAGGHDNYSYTRIPYITNDMKPEKSGVNFFTLNASISRNSLNYTMFATRGLEQRIAIFGDITKERFNGLSIEQGDPEAGTYRNLTGGVSFSRQKYFHISKFFNVGYSINALYSTNIETSNKYMYAMMSPVFEPTEQSKTLFMPEFRNRSYFALGLKPIFEVSEKLYLKTEGYCYMPDITSYIDVANKLKYIFAATIVYQSPVGAISFNYSRYFRVSSGKANYYTFNIGLTMFHKKGIVY